MLLTRVGFFKLLAAIGIGQATKVTTCKVGDVCELSYSRGQLPQKSDDKQCLRQVPGKYKFEWTRCNVDCEEGEERCPLGHCQKPDMFMVDEVILAATTQRFVRQLHVCSTCKILYTK